MNKLWVLSTGLLLSILSEGFADKQQVDLIIEGGIVVTMNESRSIFKNGSLAVQNDRIIAVGRQEEIQELYTSDQVINAKGKAIIPGLVNGHAHLPMTIFRGIADDKDLEDWWFNYIFPAESQNVDEHFTSIGSQLGLAEFIRGGITTFANMYFFSDVIAEETAKAGVRAMIGSDFLDCKTSNRFGFETDLESALQFVTKWKGHSLIVPALGPHSPYTVCEDNLRRIKDLAQLTGTCILIHISETEFEVNNSIKLKGDTPVAYLERIGFFEVPVIAAHIVHPTEKDIAILKKHDVTVIHNLHSNLKLASGIAPITQLMEAGVTVGLGTDSAASNNALNMWEEMDFVAKIHKVQTKNPKSVSALEALEMATINGAKALHMEESIGSLEKGKKADIVIVDLEGAHQVPLFNIYSTLIYATKASDVSTVIIDGKVVMKERQLLTLDEPSIIAEAHKLSYKLKECLNYPDIEGPQ